MGKEDQPKHRQAARSLKRRAAVRKPYERLLIVCEGEKTEPQYLCEIQRDFRLATAHVQVLHGEWGTEPQQVLAYALKVFKDGDRDRGLHPRAFDRILVVFDRDEHQSYHAALAQAAAQSGKLRSDLAAPVPVEAVASVPCFELWLLLHFEDVQAPLHRVETVTRLKRHLKHYEKGSGGHWLRTKAHWVSARQRARRLAARTTAHDGTQPFTAMDQLVHRLVHLKDDLPADPPADLSSTPRSSPECAA